MRVAFRKSFARDLRQIHDQSLLNQLLKIIHQIESAKSIKEIKGLKQVSREARYYRLRLRDYRLGLVIEADTVTFVRVLHRKDIYRYFP